MLFLPVSFNSRLFMWCAQVKINLFTNLLKIVRPRRLYTRIMNFWRFLWHHHALCLGFVAYSHNIILSVSVSSRSWDDHIISIAQSWCSGQEHNILCEVSQPYISVHPDKHSGSAAQCWMPSAVRRPANAAPQSSWCIVQHGKQPRLVAVHFLDCFRQFTLYKALLTYTDVKAHLAGGALPMQRWVARC